MVVRCKIPASGNCDVAPGLRRRGSFLVRIYSCLLAGAISKCWTKSGVENPPIPPTDDHQQNGILDSGFLWFPWFLGLRKSEREHCITVDSLITHTPRLTGQGTGCQGVWTLRSEQKHHSKNQEKSEEKNRLCIYS